MEVANRSGRRNYTGDSAVLWPAFLPLLLIVYAFALILAGVLYFLLLKGWYIIIFAPIVGAALVGGGMYLAISIGRCRNRIVGAVAGFIAGVLLYGGSYYIGLIDTFGIEAASAPELLPKYVKFRVRTDEMRDLSSPSRGPQNADGGFMGWYLLGTEALAVLLITTIFGWGSASRAYCTRCRKWMKQQVLTFPAGSGSAILDALNMRRVEEILKLPTMPASSNSPCTGVSIEYCGAKPGTMPCPVWVSVRDLRSGATAKSGFHTGFGRTMARRWELAPDEVAMLAYRAPALSTATTAAAPAVIEAPKPAKGETATEQIAIEKVSGPKGNRILTRGNIILTNLFGILPIVVVILGILLLAFGGTMMEKKGGGEAQRVTGIIMMIAGGAVALAGVIAVFMKLGTAYFRRLCRKVIGSRGDAIVRPTDPDVMFVEIVPPQNFGKVMLETATDIGYLRIDNGNRQVLFEGDKERIRIPAGAIISSVVGEHTVGQGASQTSYFYVMMRVRNIPVAWENAIVPRMGGASVFGRGKARRKMEQLNERIKQLA